MKAEEIETAIQSIEDEQVRKETRVLLLQGLSQYNVDLDSYDPDALDANFFHFSFHDPKMRTGLERIERLIQRVARNYAC